MVDYWSEDLVFLNYPVAFKRLTLMLGEDFYLLIKEYSGVWGFCKPEFYECLEGMDCITTCPTNVLSQECIDASDAVLVWAGAVGFEAALRGKPVFTTCDPYYFSGGRFKRINFDTNAHELS